MENLIYKYLDKNANRNRFYSELIKYFNHEITRVYNKPKYRGQTIEGKIFIDNGDHTLAPVVPRGFNCYMTEGHYTEQDFLWLDNEYVMNHCGAFIYGKDNPYNNIDTSKPYVYWHKIGSRYQYLSVIHYFIIMP